MSATVIARHSTMGEVVEAYPSAQGALFRRYHIGGCNTCGYRLGDTLEEVARRHSIFDADEVVAFVEHAGRIDRRLGVRPGEVAAALGSDPPLRLIDVRSPAEWELARIGGAALMSMTGGLDAWSLEVDLSVPRYEVARDPSDGGASLRPLRSAVLEAEGHQSSEGAL